MKNFRKAGIFAATILFAVVAVTFTACEKEDKLVTEDAVAEEMPDVYVKNGVLCFKNGNIFNNFINKVGMMSPSELDNRESSLGFVSLRTFTNQAYDELNCVETESEYFETLIRNSDFIKLVNDDVIRTFPDSRYLAAANIDKIFMISGVAHKLADDGYIIDAPIEKIHTATRTNSKSRQVVELIKTESNYKYTGYESNDCVGTQAWAVYYDESRSSGYRKHRKARLDMYITLASLMIDVDGLYKIPSYLTVKSSSWKKNMFGNYTPYNTSHQFDDIKSSIYAPISWSYETYDWTKEWIPISKLVTYNNPHSLSEAYYAPIIEICRTTILTSNNHPDLSDFTVSYFKGKSDHTGISYIDWLSISCAPLN